jgi:GNAT superfamily N-acetyltransferase
VKLTIEGYVAGPAVDILYDVYVASFTPLATAAAARHLLDPHEFAGEMADPRIDKYVVWDDEGQPIGLTTLTTDMSAVPWISQEFYTSRYPRHTATGKLFYLGFTLVAPDCERDGIAGRILAKVVRRLRDEGGVCGFDVCARNDDVHHIGASIARLSRSMPVRVEKIDVQSYYVADFTACA